MNKNILFFVGILFVFAGGFTAFYQIFYLNHFEYNKMILEKVKEGEELLHHSLPQSRDKALSIFSELSSKDIPENLKFRVRFSLARALEKSKEEKRALEIYKELNQSQKLIKDDREILSCYYGNLLLKLNQEVEGKGHLEEVLRISKNHKIRSMTLSYIADYYFRKKDINAAKKNYMLAVEEDPSNTHARVGWGKTLMSSGNNLASYEIFDNYIADSMLFDEKGDKNKSEYQMTLWESGMARYRSKQYYKAIEIFKKYSTLGQTATDQEKAFYYIAESYNAIGRQKDALIYLDKVLTNSVHIMDAQALFKKGAIYFYQKKYSRSASVFQKVIDNSPGTVLSKKASAWKKEALDHLTDSLREEPEYHVTTDEYKNYLKENDSKIYNEDEN